MSTAPELSSYYDAYWASGLYPEGSGLAPQVLAHYRQYVRSTSRCIDVGCGNGRTSGPALARLGASYVGVDLSGTAVAQTRELGLDARVLPSDGSLPFPDACFEFAACLEVLEHVFRPDQLAAEMYRVLAPGGVLVASVPNVVYWRRRVDHLLGRWNPFGDDRSVSEPWRDPHLRFFTASSLRALLETTHFSALHVGGHGGALLRDLPGLRQLSRKERTGAYAVAERLVPSVLGARLHATAVKPTA